MFDIGWTELVVIGVVALIVIGPKDLPEMFRTLGRFTAKARSMARDFQRAMESAADEAGVKDVAKDLRAVTSPSSLGLDKVKEAAAKFEKWDPLKPAPKPAAASAPAAAPGAAASGQVQPAEPVAHGPATQALADAKAEQKIRHAAAVEALRKPAAPVTAPDAVPAPEPAARKTRAKPKTADAGADRLSKAVAASRSPAPRKPRAKKSDAESAES
jgi:sec-independent protein translocase protein TatB